MKSIKEKAEAYDSIIEKANKMHSENCDDCKACIEELIPELAESDEKIRKELLVFCRTLATGRTSVLANNIDFNRWISWLEKQASYTTIVETGDGGINALVTRELPTDGEQNPTDKVEPKFKVGDWLIFNEHHNSVYQVERIDNYRYYLRHYLGGTMSVHFDNELIRLWTLQDAKSGDVLCNYHEAYDNPLIFILKKFEHVNFGLVRPSDYSSYCFLTADDRPVFKEGTYHHEQCNIKPATKEQRDTLLKAMADAGYTFDFEKKELKKIEQKLCMIQWKGDNLKEVIGFTGKDKNFDKWFASFEEYERYVHEHNNIFKLFNKDGSHNEVPVGAWIVKTPDGYIVASKAVLKQKPVEWSEEDEKTLNEIFSVAARASLRKSTLFGKSYDYIKWQNWLESLRPQSQWKPSKEQIVALRWVLNNVPYNKHKEEISGLLDQIKDL